MNGRIYSLSLASEEKATIMFLVCRLGLRINVFIIIRVGQSCEYLKGCCEGLLIL